MGDYSNDDHVAAGAAGGPALRVVVVVAVMLVKGEVAGV